MVTGTFLVFDEDDRDDDDEGLNDLVNDLKTLPIPLDVPNVG